ncbi:MAG: PAS domain S-box protein, partial [Saprospiraceae bacterium]|nr:PAS domain S-box protein [Saprospiraceae bacterium]
MLTFQHNTHFARLTWLLVGIVFLADYLLPRLYDVVFAYLLAHFLAIFFRERSDVLLLAVVTSVLTIVGLVFKPHDAPWGQMLLERTPAIISFWAAAFFVIKFIALREEEELLSGRFMALFEHATQGIVLSDKQGVIVMANPASEKLFEYNPGEMIGQKVEILIPMRYASKHEAHRNSYHHNPHARPMGIGLSLQGRQKDGTEFPVEVSLSPFKIQQGEYVVAFIVDNTVRKNHEHSILSQKQELSNLSKALKELNETLEHKVAERTHELEIAQS